MSESGVASSAASCFLILDGRSMGCVDFIHFSLNSLSATSAHLLLMPQGQEDMLEVFLCSGVNILVKSC